jgi:hypothetical protein
MILIVFIILNKNSTLSANWGISYRVCMAFFWLWFIAELARHAPHDYITSSHKLLATELLLNYKRYKYIK